MIWNNLFAIVYCDQLFYYMQYIHIFCYQFIHTCKTKTIISKALNKVNYFMYFGGLRFKKKTNRECRFQKEETKKINLKPCFHCILRVKLLKCIRGINIFCSQFIQTCRIKTIIKAVKHNQLWLIITCYIHTSQVVQIADTSIALVSLMKLSL